MSFRSNGCQQKSHLTILGGEAPAITFSRLAPYDQSRFKVSQLAIALFLSNGRNHTTELVIAPLIFPTAITSFAIALQPAASVFVLNSEKSFGNK
jgi:hypothetical protein